MALPIIASIGAGLLGALGARSAARTQANAAQQASNAQLTATRETNDMLSRFRQQDIARFDPFMRSGLGAQNALAFNMGLGPRPEGYGGFQATPGFQFATQQADDAVQGSVAARQGLASGAAMDALQANRMGMANQEFGNYLARLQGMAAGGQNAAGMQGQTSANFGGQIGQNMMTGGQAAAQGFANVGNARAAGTMGGVNALMGGVNNALGAWQFNQMQNAFSNPQTGGAPMTSMRPMARPF